MKMLYCFVVLMMLLPGAPMAHAAKEPPKPGHAAGSIDVDMVGVVRTGIMAIGAETTGTTITALGLTWELDLQGKKEWTELAEKADGKAIAVTGSLKIVEGVERGPRTIVVVKSMKMPPK